MAAIIVVDDEPDVRDVLEYNLKEAGHEVAVVGCGREGLQLVRERRPDLVLLDLMLPDLPGTEVCRAIKAEETTRGVAVVILTARGHEIDRVVGFELGADDYVTKPFSVRELLLRIRAVLRRAKSTPSETSDLIELGALKIDRAEHRVWVSDQAIQLTNIELRLLLTLYDRRTRVQSRETLLYVVWGDDARISLRTVDAHVKRLRHKLGAARDYVQTVRGVGYRFSSEPAR
jgi:two-component system phosphate regulon response regulator PhoB